jgi:chromosome segregation ATPase
MEKSRHVDLAKQNHDVRTSNNDVTTLIDVLQQKLFTAEQSLVAKTAEISKLSSENRHLSCQVNLLWGNVHGSKSCGVSPVNSFSGLTPPTKEFSSPFQSCHEVEVQSLRDALDQVTKEKKGLEVLCLKLKEAIVSVTGDTEVGGVDVGGVEEQKTPPKSGSSLENTHLKSLSKEIKLLKLKLEQVNKDKSAELDVSLEECDRLHSEKAQLMKEKDLLATSLRQEAVYTHHLEDECSTLESQLSEAKSTAQQVVDELGVERSKACTISEDYDNLLKEYHQLQAELEEQTLSSTELIASLQQELEDSQQKYTQLNEVSMTAKQELELLKSEFQEAQSSLSRQEEANSLLVSQHVELEAEVASYSAECSKLREGLSAASDLSRTHLLHEIEGLKAELYERNREIMELGSHDCQATTHDSSVIGDEHTTENVLLRQEISDLKLSVTLMEQSLLEKDNLLEEMRSRLEDSNDDIDFEGEGKTLQNLQEECCRLTDELNSLKESPTVPCGVHTPTSPHAEHEDSYNTLKQVVTLLTIELQKEKENTNSLRMELSEKEEKVQHLSLALDLQKQATFTSKQNGFSSKEVDVLSERLHRSEVEKQQSLNLVDMLQTSEAQLRAECNRLSEELNKGKVEILRLQRVLESEHLSLQSLSREQEGRISALSRECVSLSVETSSTEAECNTQERRVHEREQSIAKLTEEVMYLRTQHSNLSDKLITGNSLCTNVVCAKLHQEKQSLREIVEKLSKENKGLAEQRDQLKAALSTPGRKSLEDKGRGVQKSPRSDFWECGFGPPANSRSVQVDLTKKQLNYLRTKLGYALTELRLYKKQKEEVDG